MNPPEEVAEPPERPDAEPPPTPGPRRKTHPAVLAARVLAVLTDGAVLYSQVAPERIAREVPPTRPAPPVIVPRPPVAARVGDPSKRRRLVLIAGGADAGPVEARDGALLRAPDDHPLGKRFRDGQADGRDGRPDQKARDGALKKVDENSRGTAAFLVGWYLTDRGLHDDARPYLKPAREAPRTYPWYVDGGPARRATSPARRPARSASPTRARILACSTRQRPRPSRRSGFLALWILASTSLPSPRAIAGVPDPAPAQAPIRQGDRVAWVGSSSTKIGVWPRTVEFLPRTRHPGLDLRFRSFSTGGGTFATGLEHLDEWLEDFRPTLVVFNYGANDAGAGREGLPKDRDDMEKCVAKTEGSGARVILVSPRAADPRKSGAEAAARRTLYAETMLDFGRGRGWTVIDVHQPLDALLRANQEDDPSYSILKDPIHLTDPAYIGWGFFFYDRLDLPRVRSEAILTALGDVRAAGRCEIRDVKAAEGSLAFTRVDAALPILPPGPLPPRHSVPMEAHSRYLLAVTDLPPGDYEIRCEDRPIGGVDAGSRASGVNLNALLLDQGREAPWSGPARAIWDGDAGGPVVGTTRWRFEVRKP